MKSCRPPDRLAARERQVGALLKHPSAGPPTELAIERVQVLFGGRAGTGIAMAARALRGAMPEERVRAICLAYAEKLRGSL